MMSFRRLLLCGFACLLASSQSFALHSFDTDDRWLPEPSFKSELAAVHAASNLYNPRSIQEDREYMGVILNEAGNFRYTVTPGVRAADGVSIRVPGEDWENVVAIWHTHGAEQSRYQYFSDTDTDLVNSLGKPLYLADYTGKLKVFRAGDGTMGSFRARRLGLPSRAGYAAGSEVMDECNELVSIRVSQC